MNRLWVAIGRIGGYVTWIPVWLVIRFTTRTRVIVVCGDEVLVLQGWLSTGKWAFPGGGMHRNEQPSSAAARELKEETGIVVKNTELRPLGMMKQIKGQAHNFHGFYVELPAKPRLQLQKIEITQAKWYVLNSLQNLPSEQHVQMLLDAWQKQR